MPVHCLARMKAERSSTSLRLSKCSIWRAENSQARILDVALLWEKRKEETSKIQKCFGSNCSEVTCFLAGGVKWVLLWSVCMCDVNRAADLFSIVSFVFQLARSQKSQNGHHQHLQTHSNSVVVALQVRQCRLFRHDRWLGWLVGLVAKMMMAG